MATSNIFLALLICMPILGKYDTFIDCAIFIDQRFRVEPVVLQVLILQVEVLLGKLEMFVQPGRDRYCSLMPVVGEKIYTNVYLISYRAKVPR